MGMAQAMMGGGMGMGMFGAVDRQLPLNGVGACSFDRFGPTSLNLTFSQYMTNEELASAIDRLNRLFRHPFLSILRGFFGLCLPIGVLCFIVLLPVSIMTGFLRAGFFPLPPFIGIGLCVVGTIGSLAMRSIIAREVGAKLERGVRDEENRLNNAQRWAERERNGLRNAYINWIIGFAPRGVGSVLGVMAGLSNAGMDVCLQLGAENPNQHPNQTRNGNGNATPQQQGTIAASDTDTDTGATNVCVDPTNANNSGAEPSAPPPYDAATASQQSGGSGSGSAAIHPFPHPSHTHTHRPGHANFGSTFATHTFGGSHYRPGMSGGMYTGMGSTGIGTGFGTGMSMGMGMGTGIGTGFGASSAFGGGFGGMHSSFGHSSFGRSFGH